MQPQRASSLFHTSRPRTRPSTALSVSPPSIPNILILILILILIVLLISCIAPATATAPRSARPPVRPVSSARSARSAPARREVPLAVHRPCKQFKTQCCCHSLLLLSPLLLSPPPPSTDCETLQSPPTAQCHESSFRQRHQVAAVRRHLAALSIILIHTPSR